MFIPLSLMSPYNKRPPVWGFKVAGENKTYLCFHWPNFFLCFKQIWSSSADFHKDPQYKLSRKCVKLEWCWYIQIGGRTDMTKLTDAHRTYAEASK
jgi:hypothetical protein